MTKIAISPNPNGTGTFTIAAPNSNTDRTLTLPDAGGVVATQEYIPTALNATGSAPIYACRAWVNFNGTGTVAIRASGNVSSITDLGVGTYRINFATAMPNANYSVSHFSKWTGGPYILGVSGGATSYTSSDLTVINGTVGGVDTDIDVLSIAIFC